MLELHFQKGHGLNKWCWWISAIIFIVTNSVKSMVALSETVDLDNNKYQEYHTSKKTINSIVEITHKSSYFVCINLK